jgi:hypothetical protein
MKRTSDLTPYVNTLPYASEIFGVYQPLIGWKSARTTKRLRDGFSADVAHVLRSLYRQFPGRFEVTLGADHVLERIQQLEPASLAQPATGPMNSFVLDSVRRQLPPDDEFDTDVWGQVLTAEQVSGTLTKEVVPQVTQWYQTASENGRRAPQEQTRVVNAMLADQLNRESAVAGYLLYLQEQGHFDVLEDIFYKHAGLLPKLQALLAFRDPLDVFDPMKDIDRAVLAPIGVVHLFRQYFFELDTFLGPPVSHVWLSPGATVELVEISTRKRIVERTTESSFESTVKTESSTTEQDEVSDAVKEENRSDTKLGVNATATESWIGGSATASASMNLDTAQSKAREDTHRRMREQTEKLSTEIRKNYKSTFKVVTEETDTSSKRYVLSNTTDDLLNYELRRKMRQVGVQVQDIGTYLCWQTYVDDPGRQLGIAKLVHIAKDPEVGSQPEPEKSPQPQTIVTQHPLSIPFVPATEDTLPDEDMEEAYEDGVEVNLDTSEGSPEAIKWKFGGNVAECDQSGYEYSGPITFDYGGNDVRVEVGKVIKKPGRIRFGIRVRHINFHGHSPVQIVAKVTWVPSQALLDEVAAENAKKVAELSEQTKREYQKAFVDAARERIKLASSIEARKFEDLREEERIVVYRKLIQDMLTSKIPTPDDRTRHTVAELVNTIFDVEKMLYFVAPEWWRPRLHRSHQALGGIRTPAAMPPTSGSDGSAPSSDDADTVYGAILKAAGNSIIKGIIPAPEETPITTLDTVAWGGASGQRPDSYYITDESAPAKLGSSLGWLLQLDGDDLRNAFLNAPWVKAVIPIRPGKERAAINWLSRVDVEGADGLDDDYVASSAELDQIPHSGPEVTIRDAIDHLCDMVAEKYDQSLTVGRYPSEEIDDDNRVSATPVDKVFEHGFYPLQGGFRVKPADEPFEVFDQWVEVLPTDQVVPVEVSYDPKTGRQL